MLLFSFMAYRSPREVLAGSTPASIRRLSHSVITRIALSRPAQALLTLRPAGSLDPPRRPSSRGFSPIGCPTKPLVSYRTNRQLSGWHLPPLVTHAFGAHKIRSGSNVSALYWPRIHAALAGLALPACR